MAKKDWLYKEMQGILFAKSGINVQADFVVPIDDTLVPPYHHGDYLLIHAQPDIFEGSLVSLLLTGNPTSKSEKKSFSRLLTQIFSPFLSMTLYNAAEKLWAG